MNNELLSIETAVKLARYDKAVKYIKEKIEEDKKLYKEYDKNPIAKDYVKIDQMALMKVLNILEGNNEQTL